MAEPESSLFFHSPLCLSWPVAQIRGFPKGRTILPIEEVVRPSLFLTGLPALSWDAEGGVSSGTPRQWWGVESGNLELWEWVPLDNQGAGWDSFQSGLGLSNLQYDEV